MAEQSTTEARSAKTEKADTAEAGSFVVDGVHPDPMTAMRPGVAASTDTDDERVRLVPIDWQVQDVAFPDPTAKPDADGYVPTVVISHGPGTVPFYVADKDAAKYIEAAAGHGLAITKVSV